MLRDLKEKILKNTEHDAWHVPVGSAGRFGEAELAAHGHLLNGELRVFGKRIEHRLDGAFGRYVDILIHIKEEHPLSHKLVPVQAIIHHHELVVIISVEPLLLLYILQRHEALLHPRLQHLQNLRMNPTRVVNHKMRSLPEQSHMVRYPLPHSLGTQIPVQGRPAIKIIVLGLGRKQRKIQGSVSLCQGLYGVRHVEVAVPAAGCGGVK